MPDPSKLSNRDAYLDLIKRSITNYNYLGGESAFDQFRCVAHYDLKRSEWNIDRVACPLTLLTKGQLDLIEASVVHLEEKRVPGDFIEAGVWRGGVIVLLRALLDAYNIKRRKVFAADSFAGIPFNTLVRDDPVDSWADRWVATFDEVRQNIHRFGLLDERIKFAVGFFADSLKQLSRERFALVRLDSDSYDSVLTSLEYLYPLTSKGGIVIIDDWHLAGCKLAVEHFRQQHGINDDVIVRDHNAYWVKSQEYAGGS